MNKEDLVQLLDALGKKYTFSNSKPFLQTQCFFQWNHKRGDKHPSFSIKIDENGPSLCKCFCCHQNYISLSDAFLKLNEFEKGKFDGLVEFINNSENNSLEGKVNRAEKKCLKIYHKKETVNSKDALEFSKKQFDQFEKKYPEYATTRKISKKAFEFWDLRVDQKENRLIFPIKRMEDSQVVGVTGREMKDPPSKFKYFNYWNFDKSSYFFGEHLINKQTEILILVEGKIDVVRLWQELNDLYPNHVFLSCMGASLSRVQAFKLRQLELPVILMFDGDKAGKDCERSCIYQLKRYLPLYRSEVTPDKDPGDQAMSKEDLRKYIEEAEFVF